MAAQYPRDMFEPNPPAVQINGELIPEWADDLIEAIMGGDNEDESSYDSDTTVLFVSSDDEGEEDSDEGVPYEVQDADLTHDDTSSSGEDDEEERFFVPKLKRHNAMRLNNN